MTPKEIKEECNLLYKQIQYCNERLNIIRADCKHEKTFEGLYEWRVGSINPATICEDCGECINIYYGKKVTMTTTPNKTKKNKQ